MSIAKRACQAAGIATALLGLTGSPTVAQAAKVRYRCADGTMLLAHFKPGRVDLTVGGSTATLPQAMSADGGRYLGDNLTFWIKGRGADLTRGAVQTHCSSF